MTAATGMFSLDHLDVFQRPGATIEKREDGYHAGCWVTLASGWVLSIQWGNGNYSDNYSRDYNQKPGDSTTAEIAVWREGDTHRDFVPWGTDGEWAETIQAYVSMDRVQHVLDLLQEDKLVRTFQPPPPPPPQPELRAIDNWPEDEDA